MSKIPTSITGWPLATLRLFALFLLLTSLNCIPFNASFNARTAIAAPFSSSFSSPLFAASRLQGYLPDWRSENSFQLLTNEANSRVSVTLNFDPDPSLPGKVNFFVVSEEGTRQMQAGAPAYSVAIAAGNPLPGADDYTRRAEFNVVKQKSFTVIVYSDAPRPVHYSLTVFNAILVDTWGQATMGQQTQNFPTQTTNNINTTNTNTNNSSIPNPVVVNPSGLQITKPTTRLTNLVFAPGEQQIITIKPSRADVGVVVTMQYEPRDINNLRWLAQMYLFNEDRYHQYQAGDRAEIVNLAAGNVTPDGEEGDLRLRIRATDTTPLTLLVVNQSKQVVIYSLQVSGGRFQPQ